MIDPIEIELGDLLRSWSDEAAKLTVIAGKLQTILVIACARTGHDDTFHRDAQACDLLTQSLEAMSRFMSCIAESVPKGYIIDITQATRALPLASLAAAMAPHAVSPSDGVAGAVEMFNQPAT